MSPEIDRLYRVGMSKIPRGVGLNLEFMDILLMYLQTAGCDVDKVSQPYHWALEWMEEMYVDMTFGEIEFWYKNSMNVGIL